MSQIRLEGGALACAAVAYTAVAYTGGSANAVLHLPAMAHELGIEFTVHDVQSVFRRTIFMAERQSGGRRLASERYQAGGAPVVLKSLIAGGILNGDALTIDGTKLSAALAKQGPIAQDALSGY
jgi:dihydroxy-acid dehydratase